MRTQGDAIPVEGQVGAYVRAAGTYVAVPEGADASDEQGAHQYHGKRALVFLEHAHHALVSGEQAWYGGGGDGIHAEQVARHKPRRAQGAGHRHVNPVIVEGRQIQRGEGAAAGNGRPIPSTTEKGLQGVGSRGPWPG